MRPMSKFLQTMINTMRQIYIEDITLTMGLEVFKRQSGVITVR